MSTAPHSQGVAPSSYDVAFVGTGISSTFTLVELLARLERQHAKSVRILLIDKDPDFFKGVPYGNRSGDLGLIISRVSDFLPAAQFPQFSEWLASNRGWAFDRFFAAGGDPVAQWRDKYWHEVEAGAIAELYLPRYLFGLYFERLATTAIASARERGAAVCETALGEVLDLDDVDGQLTILTRDETGTETTYRADRVVLGVGSAPPARILEGKTGELSLPADCVLVDDPFDPGIAGMLERIRAAVGQAPGPRGRVLVIGSNAGALDVIFNLMNDRTVASAVGRIEVLSTSGRFPELFYAQPAGFRPANVGRALKHLAERGSIFAEDIYEAVKHDIDSARQDGLTITDTFSEISAGFTSLLDRLAPAEKLRFANDTGARIGTLQRKVGQDYWSVLDDLVRDGTLVVSRGRFPDDLEGRPNDDLVAIVNCSGSRGLIAGGRKGLIGSLLERGRLRATESGFGIRVNDDLETDIPGLFVIGPLLTGNVLRDDPAWNLEHCGRIALFARQLAVHLVERAFAGAPA